MSPAHRLDRLTAGVLLFTTRRELRGAYQTLFARGLVRKTYLARAAVDPALSCRGGAKPNRQAPRPVTGRLRSPASSMPRRWWSIIGDGLYRLTPRTGRTHQLRVHMASLGLPITGDPLYPNVIDVAGR